MNKPLKLLLVVGVLAFAAAGLYYAMVSPGRAGKPEVAMTRRDQSGGPKFDAGATRPPTVVVGKEPEGSWPTPLPEEKPSTPPVTASAPVEAPAPSTPTGFSPAPEPMKPLPSALPGFDPVTADGAPAKPEGASTPPMPVAAPTPGAGTAPVSAPLSAPPSTTASPAAPVAAPAPKPASGLDLPPLPTPSAPAKPAPVAKTAAAPRSDTYTVKEGDSIASIWRTVSGSERGWEKLLAANPGVDPSRLKIGQVLKVPDHAASAASETRVASAPAPSRAGGSPGSYTVQSGDTLSRIAGKTLGDSKRWKEIYEANRDSLGNDPGALEVGQVLRIPGKAAATKPTATKPAVDKPAVDKPAVDKPAVDKPVDNPGSTGGVTTPAPAVSPSPAPSPAPR